MSLFDRFRKKKDKERLAAKAKPSMTPASPEPKREVAAKPAQPKQAAKETPAKKPLSAQTSRALVHPLVTEKTVREAQTYAFAVHPDANKRQIADAVAALYGVKPVAVRMQNRRGKGVRYGRSLGSTKNWKKALVALKPGETIQLNENV